MCGWSALGALSVSHTRLSGGLPDCLRDLTVLTSLDASHCALERAGMAVFQMRQAAQLSLAYNNISYNAADCPGGAGGTSVVTVDLSGNPWAGVGYSAAMACFISDNGGGRLVELLLDDMQLGGALPQDLNLPNTFALSVLSLRGNNLTVSTGMAAASAPMLVLNTLLLGGNSALGPLLNIDSTPVPILDVSDTAVSYCYDGAALGSTQTKEVSVRGTRPAATCSRAVERAVLTTAFQACPSQPVLAAAAAAAPPSPSPVLPSAASDDLSSVFCQVPARRVAFVDSGLVCPSWSTLATQGQAVLSGDAAFLGFWGCVCPLGLYWGYSGLQRASAGLLQEAAAMTADAWLGRNESALMGRMCVPCPPNVQCSPLAVVDAPHVLTGSRYPLHSLVDARLALDPLAQRNLVYVESVPCLHPAVCNRNGVAADMDWAQWVALMKRRTAAGADNTSSSASFSVGSSSSGSQASLQLTFQCREGHDPSSLKCSRCLPGYWLDGFLCHRCAASYSVLAPLSAFVAVCALIAYLVYSARYRPRRVRPVSLSVSSNVTATSTTSTELSVVRRSHSVSLVLWFLQVSATLQASSQINAAASSTATADSAEPGSGLSWLDNLLSFRPWASECVVGTGWDFRSSSALLLALPWAVLAVGLVLGRLRRLAVDDVAFGACILLDMLYIPVTQRSMELFNTDQLDSGKVRTGRTGTRARTHAGSLQMG